MRAIIHTMQGDFDAQIPIPGEHNVYNALAGTAVGLEMGLTIDEIARGIAKAQTIAGRTNLLKCGGITVIDDCYNANPVSMKASIDVLAHTKGRRIAVLGDMGELGKDEIALHYGVGLAVGQARIEALFCAGTLAEEYAKAAAEANLECEVFYFTNREDMTEALCGYVKEGDTVLIKASHFMEFPKVVEALKSVF
jgi:UDP-N-acetylmuramoyl-tripeptide--D-alanyl-D-alanine ligase